MPSREQDEKRLAHLEAESEAWRETASLDPVVEDSAPIPVVPAIVEETARQEEINEIRERLGE